MEALKELYEKSKELDQSWSWTSEPETSELIASLIKMTDAKNVLEIGTYTGFTSAYMIDAIPDDGKYIGIDVENLVDKKILKLIKETKKDFEFVFKNSLDFLSSTNETFDFIFIDSLHEFDHLLKEFQLCEKLIFKGGTIAIHDSLLIPDVINFIAWLHRFKHFEIITLPTPNIEGRGGASGLTLIKCLYGK